MKVLKGLSIIAFIVGFILIVGAFGTDDFYVMELHEPHTFQFGLVIVGALLCAPFTIMGIRQ